MTEVNVDALRKPIWEEAAQETFVTPLINK